MSGASDEKNSGSIAFLKGTENYLQPDIAKKAEWTALLSKASSQISEALSAKNVAFLFGSGASSFYQDKLEWGISTMAPLAKKFCDNEGKDDKSFFLTAAEKLALKDEYGIDLTKEPYSANLEKFLEVLFSLRLVLHNSVRGSDKIALELIIKCIDKTKRFIFSQCTEGAFSPFLGDTKVLDLYKAFYRKLVLRDRSLPRPWIFTTNYDLFNETALDQLGLPYCNGFSGTIERRFNPSTFRYALAEQIDISQKRWVAVDGFIYLCKLHGSVSWIEDRTGLYPIRELQVPSQAGQVMIYPTPAKQNSSFGSPYSDLFREFQGRIAKEQSVLFTIGYSFSDEHVNNIIYQALTIPTFRLIIFANPEASAELKRLHDLNDPRIWIIYGETPDKRKLHYFEGVVNNLLPAQASDRVESAIAKVLDTLVKGKEPLEGGAANE